MSIGPQLCAKQTEFMNCNTKAMLGISKCSASVQGQPNNEFYKCLCESQQTQMKCYDICLDDPNLMLQKQIQMDQGIGDCKVNLKSMTMEPKPSSRIQFSTVTTIESTSVMMSSTIQYVTATNTRTLQVGNGFDTLIPKPLPSATLIVLDSGIFESKLNFGFRYEIISKLILGIDMVDQSILTS
ncbi:hypothetical protein BC833DRAFT_640340 [Globomyces pollinis-pini]|nr:hypothetical protein BC833DRAFT_640340 [Globomyces pollinis-pini]